MIKAYSVRYDEAAKTIDTHLRIDKEIEEHKNTIFTVFPPKADGFTDGFVEGIKAVVVETVPSLEEQQAKSVETLEQAQIEAAQLIEQAKIEAEQIKKNAYTEAQRKGYEDGSLKAKTELQQIQAQYAAKEKQLMNAYEEKVEALEPFMADLIASFIEKLTGVIAKDKQDIIVYLINRAIKDFDKQKEYSIKVSKEDYEYLSERKQLLLDAVGYEVEINLFEDSTLSKNQCYIETENKIVNCSLDIQLQNLITDLRLMSSL
ncbi:MAG: FliH/SctL family protein [Mobilitalea sp.]